MGLDKRKSTGSLVYKEDSGSDNYVPLFEDGLYVCQVDEDGVVSFTPAKVVAMDEEVLADTELMVVVKR